MSMSSRAILEVVFATPLRRRFDYTIPANFKTDDIVGCRVVAPFGKRSQTGIVVAIKADSEWATEKLKPVTRRLDTTAILNKEMLRLALWASRYYHHSLGDICFSMLPVKYRQTAALTLPVATYWSLTDEADQVSLNQTATKQQHCVTVLKEHVNGLSTSQLGTEGISSSIIKALAAKGVLESREELIDTPISATRVSPPTLTEEQEQALQKIKLDKFCVSLINGVTGSGKTEIYIRAIETTLAAGKQALLLVPEIGLTPQTVKRLKHRLNYPVTVMHSGLNASEQASNWSLCTLATPRLVVATRSGLFAPLTNLGIIVVDEEHDMSFKQASGWLYSARDLAVVRASQNDIPILLGSATPSLESLQHAENGTYQEIVLTERATQQPLPQVKILDIRKLPVQEGLSKPLMDVMSERLRKGEQVMVFINRRGFAPVLMCHDCGWHAECARCDSQYTLHRAQNLLRCHHCDSRQQLPVTCPNCQSANIKPVGTGTERIEEYLQQTFPDYAMVRIDRDSTRRKDAMQDYVEAIKKGEYQILIGTQMLAKGHHFPDLTLVVIVDMDGALFCSDFRAVERFGQLLTQVSGRAGRGKQPGQIILQTRQPDHPHLTTLVSDNYRDFAMSLLRERQLTHWPPFTYLTLLRAEAVKEHHPVNFLTEVRQQHMAIATDNDVALLGPVPATPFKKAGKFRYQLLLQAKDRKCLHSVIETMIECIEQKKLAKSVRWTLDVDPLEMV